MTVEQILNELDDDWLEYYCLRALESDDIKAYELKKKLKKAQKHYKKLNSILTDLYNKYQIRTKHENYF